MSGPHRLKHGGSNQMQELRDSMQSHLKLHFETEEASDEMVLQAYPATIRCVCWFTLSSWQTELGALPSALPLMPFVQLAWYS